MARLGRGFPAKVVKLRPTVAPSGGTGNASITQADNTVAATGTIQIKGVLSVTQAGNTVVVTGIIKILGVLGVTQAGNTVVATGVGTSGVSGVVSIVQADNTVVAVGVIRIKGVLSKTQDNNTILAAGGPPGLTWSWVLEAKISGVWTDISEDVLCHDHPVVAARGIEGSSVTDRVASPGSFSCALDNGKSNSAGLIGYYSLDHANKRAGFAEDTPLRLKLTSGVTTKYVWHGYLIDLQPTPGQFQELKSFLSGTDFMQKMVEHHLDGIPVQENKRSDQVMQTILDNMATAPLNTSLGVDSFALRLALHSEQDEKSTAMSATAKLCQSAMAYAFIKGNATDGETFTYQRELARLNNAVAATLSDTMSGISITRSTDRKKNKITGMINPARIDAAATTLLAALTNEFPLDAGDSQTIILQINDPSGAGTRISGKEIVTPLVADTHYKMSATSESGGNDMNGNLTTGVSSGGNVIFVTVQNTGSVRGYINKLEIYGKGIYLYDPIHIRVQSGSADKELTYDFYYLDDYYRGKDYTTAVHTRASGQFSDVDSVWFYADANSTLMGYALNVDIGDRVSISETVNGLNAEYTVNHVTYTITTTGLLRVQWKLEFASVYTFFTLDDAVLGVLDDVDNVLSPF